MEARRKYLAWIRKNVAFIPTLCPEELVLRAAGQADLASTTSQHHKNRLRALTVALFGNEVSNEMTDQHGEWLLANNRSNSAELAALAQQLRNYLAAVHPPH